MKKAVVGVVMVLIAGAGTAAWYYWPWRGNSDVLRLPGVVEIQEVRLGSKVGGRVAEKESAPDRRAHHAGDERQSVPMRDV